MNFVHGDAGAWADVAAPAGRDIPLTDLAPRLRLGRSIWIVQAFHVLRQRGWPVTLSDRLDSEAINVMHVDDLRWSPDLWRHFLVTVRADREPAFVSQVEIVQNEASLWADSDVYIPHWPQPGLIPRDPARGTRIETVVFMGHPFNLAEEFRDERFRTSLEAMGMRLEVRDRDWWDYSATDVVLAVRDGTPMHLAVKPASKLVNAWLAGCPAILKPEVGYVELRESTLDYLEASTATEVLGALRQLRRDPELFQRMVENGLSRARELTTDRVADRWETVLSEAVVPAYERWQHEHTRLRAVRTALGWARRRLWGYQTIQTPPRSTLRRALNPVRRALALPGTFMPGRRGGSNTLAEAQEDRRAAWASQSTDSRRKGAGSLQRKTSER